MAVMLWKFSWRFCQRPNLGKMTGCYPHFADRNGLTLKTLPPGLQLELKCHGFKIWATPGSRVAL